jgi:hypothetical protein
MSLSNGSAAIAREDTRHYTSVRGPEIVRGYKIY